MRKLVVNTFTTLDGVMQAPGGPEEDPAGGFEHGGWSFGYWDEAMGEWMGQFMGMPFDLLLGRRTYEIFAAYWPTATSNKEIADQLFLSVGTVKQHLHHINTKLETTSRTAAAARARELGLL